MRKFFAAQSGIILILVYIQMYVQEGTYQVGFKTFETFLVLISFTFAISLILTVIRKLLNRKLNIADEVIRLSIFILPVYYVVQLLGWMADKGIIGGG